MTTYVVTTLIDENDGSSGGTGLSLREAIALADANPGADVITFATSGTINLALGELVLSTSITIDGDTNGDNKADITISGGSLSRVFSTTAGNVLLESLTITGGNAAGAGALGYGGGISNTGANLSILYSTIAGNTATTYGGGIYNSGAGTSLYLLNSTVSGNETTALGGSSGGITNEVGATATLVNATISGNSAHGAAGGIENFQATLEVYNSTITGNTAETNDGGGIANGPASTLTLYNSIVAGNFAGAVTPHHDLLNNGTLTESDNIVGGTLTDIFASVGANPYTTVQSGTLADNGGPVQTVAIKNGGVAHNAGNASLLPNDQYDLDGDFATNDPLTFDARGFWRTVQSGLDIGAFEVQLPQLSIADVTVSEDNAGTKTFAFTVSLDGPAPSGGVTFDIATANGTATTADGDYVASSLTAVTIPEDSTTYTFNVTVNGDTKDEVDETFFVNLTNVTGATLADAQAVGTIVNDDTPPTLSIGDVTLVEGDTGTTAFTFTVSLSAASGKTVAVSYATADGTALAGSDYTAVSDTLTFAPGETSKTVTVTVTGDTVSEDDQTFFVNLTSPANATIADSQAVGTITNDDAAPTLSVGDVTLVEGNAGTTSFTFTVSLSGASDAAVMVNYATSDGTALAGSDYTAASDTLIFAPGETSKTVTVLVTGETVFEQDQTFFLNLSSPTNATIADGQAVGTIANDDAAPTLSIDDVTASEADGTMTFTVTRTGASEVAASVDYATADDTAVSVAGGLGTPDFVATSGALTFSASLSATETQTITVTVNDDNVVEPSKQFFVNLFSAADATIADSQSVGTITSDDPNTAPTDIGLSSAAVGENAANGTVIGTLTATDANPGDTASYTLQDDAGGRFAISGSDLVVANGALLDYESATSHSVTVRVTDSGGLSFDKVFAIGVTDVDEAPHLYNWVGSGDLGSHGGGYQVAGVGDFNYDGTADVLWHNPTTGAAETWQLHDGNWSQSVDLGSHGAGWQVAGIGDFDGDGTSDVLWRESATGKLDAWAMQDGQWAKSTDLGSHGADWTVLGVGDFNGDGTDDVMFQNTTTGAVDEWVMANGNWSKSISLGSHDIAYSSSAIGDFDGDGTDDVLWQNPTTGAVEQWHMQNGNWAGSVDLGAHNTAYDLSAVNDFNGDGMSDVLWRDTASGHVDGWVMDNGQWFASVSLGAFDPAYALAGTGDVNHAGGADVLWHNTTTGQVGTWLLQAV
jgi:hypothetical protein